MVDANPVEERAQIISGCTVSYENRVIMVKGPKGDSSKKLYNPNIFIKIEGSEVIFSAKKLNKTTKKLLNTYKAHVNNLFKGVSEGHIYKLKICSGHFPMTVSVKGSIFEIKNFIGEKVPRTTVIKEGSTVKIDGHDIIVESINKEQAGQMAASIEQLTRRPGFDTRIFQDGIYITEKDGKIIK
jgi:large subunit ribosomal protein L6